ncbi:hypothetical protein G7046_g3750 [Stylonectria norvegica]|nr:hypothetical protein G7046_g3750 [Stylonectria norvegica]
MSVTKDSVSVKMKAENSHQLESSKSIRPPYPSVRPTFKRSIVDGSINDGFLDDGVDLSRLGLEIHTKRDIGLISIIALGWNICNSWAAVAATMIFSIVSGGPVTLLYGIILIFVLGGCCAASMAEIASVYPTAGGQYHWTGILAPKKWSREMGYCCGVINLFGWLATTAGFIITTVQVITGIAMFLHPSYLVESWHVFVIFQFLNIVFVCYNMFLMKRTSWLHDIGFGISLLGFLAILITCLARNPPKQADSFVWGTFVNSSGWSSNGVVFLVGLVNPNFIYSGLDGAIHLAEECTHAAKTIPKALMATVVVGFITSFSFAIAMTYCTTDFDAVLASPLPIIEIWYQATNSNAAAATFAVVLAICGCFAGLGCHQTASRLTYSFARDDALVLASKLSSVKVKFGVPMYSLLANGIVVAIIGCIYLGSTTAFNAMVSTGLILQQVSFAIPAGLLMWRKRSVRFLPKERSFRLGPFGWIANGLTVFLAVVALIFYCFPPGLPVTGGNMNYACVVIGVMFLFAVAKLLVVSAANAHALWKPLINSNQQVAERRDLTMSREIQEYSSGEAGIPADGGDISTGPSKELKEHVGELTFDQYTTGGLGRHLGVFSTTALMQVIPMGYVSVGRIIGTGIFSTPSSIVTSVGSVGASLLLWVLGLLLAISGLCVWLEFACMIPRSGGEKVYLEAAYRRPQKLITIVFAVQAIALGFTAAGCIVFASNIVVASGRVATEWEERGIAIGVIIFITCIHTFFPKVGVHGMNFFTVLKTALLLFIVVTGWVVLGGGVKSVKDPHASFRNAFAGSATSGNPYATGLFKVLNSYAGWSNAMYVMNEVKNPVRTIKIAGPLGLSICGVLYLLANVAYFAAATPAEIAASGTTVASFFMGKVFGTAARRALSVLVALSAFGNVMTVTFAQARVNQELAKEGVIPFPRFWASTWPFGSPSAGLILHFIPSFIVIVAIPFGNAYNFILDLEGYPGSVINFLVVSGLFYLRWSEPKATRPFRVWLPVAAFFMVGQAFQLVAPFLRPKNGKGDTPPLPYWLYCVVGIAILALSVVYWFFWWVALPKIGGYKLEPHAEQLSDGTSVITYRRVSKKDI